MPRGRPLAPLTLTNEQQDQLNGIAQSATLPYALVVRARMILASAEGLTNSAVARRCGVTQQTVGKWRRRFRAAGIEGLHDELRPGRPRTYDDDKVAALISRALQESPRRRHALEHAPPWDVPRAFPRARCSAGSPCSGSSRIWPRPSSCPPIRSSSRKCATSSGCTSTRRTTRWSCALDEKSPDSGAQSHPADAADGAWATSKATPTTTSGTARRRCLPPWTLPPGGLLAQCRKRHRHEEFLAFLRFLDREVPAELDIHLVLDNYATHKHAKVRQWLAARPRFHLHFTPTYSSWLNQVERWFGLLSQRAIKRGSFRSVADLVRQIQAFIDSHNTSATPFVWVATAQSIIDKVARIAMRISGAAH